MMCAHMRCATASCHSKAFEIRILQMRPDVLVGGGSGGGRWGEEEEEEEEGPSQEGSGKEFLGANSSLGPAFRVV